MALSASAKDYLSRFFPGPPSPLWETDPEFMELFANFALDEVVNQGDLDDAARMMAILAALLGCQGVEEYRVLLPAALRAVYHQEVCNGFNYERAGEETPDLCLQRMLEELGARSYARAEELLDLLGRILC